MNILVIGSGGREHALCYAIAKSKNCNKLYASPGNAGISHIAECYKLTSHEHIAEFCKAKDIGLVVIGPEAPLVEGIVDYLQSQNITVFGPSRAAAKLEESKTFTKNICTKYNIPTAKAADFTDLTKAHEYIKQQGVPIVIKADGLAAGKGVAVCTSLNDALSFATECLEGNKFGDAGSSILIEECLVGKEASFFALCDGTTAIDFGTACDYKRVGDGDIGPNTGGMGTFSPAHIIDDATYNAIKKQIISPTMQAMADMGTPYTGFLFAGLMLTNDGPKLIEYNARMGDPETQSIMPRLKSDIVELMLAACNGQLAGKQVEFSDKTALTIVMATQGYPNAYEKGSVIKGVENLKDAIVFHAGTAYNKDSQLTAIGGRVLNITCTAGSLKSAKALAYSEVKKIDWPQGFYRNDIGDGR